MDLLNFGRWEILFESDKFDDEIALVKKTLDDKMGELHAVPNFQTFRRPGEPVQTSVLFANHELDSFSLNFANGKLYSIDFWGRATSSSKPAVTMYSRGAKMEDMIALMPEVSANTKANHKIKESENIDEKTIVPEKEKDMKLQPGWEKVVLKNPKEKAEAAQRIASLEKNMEMYEFEIGRAS